MKSKKQPGTQTQLSFSVTTQYRSEKIGKIYDQITDLVYIYLATKYIYF